MAQGLRSLKMPEAFGSGARFLSLLRTETEGRGQNARPINEVYEIYLPNYGAVEVKIPVGNQKVKPKLRTPIVLKEMVLDFIPEVRTLSNGKKRVTPRFILKAHSFELKEGGNSNGSY